MSPAQAPHEIAAEAIRRFQKYRDMHGDEAVAKIQAVSDFIDAEPGECEPHPQHEFKTGCCGKCGLTREQQSYEGENCR